METQVKERLTGAIILVALVVLLVPELLSGPGRSAPAVTSKVGEPPMRSYTVNLADGGTQQVAPAVAAPAESEPLEAKLVPKESAPQTPPAPKSEEKPAAVEKPAVEKPAAEEKPPVTPALSKPTHVATAEPPPSVTGWSVQLGTFQSRDNAQRLVRQLKGKGFNAFILDRGGRSGKWYRVRVGPAADRVAAAALLAKLRKIGHSGSIVRASPGD